MDKLGDASNSDLSKLIQTGSALSGTKLIKDVSDIVAGYLETDTDVAKIANAIFQSKESRKDILNILSNKPGRELSPLLGSISDQYKEQDKFIKDVNKLIFASEIKGGNEFLIKLKNDFKEHKKSISKSVSSVKEEWLDKKDKAKILLNSASLSTFKTLITERLVLHLLESGSEDESGKKETIAGMKRLLKFSERDENMGPFIENVVNIIGFHSHIDKDDGVSEKSFKFIEELLAKNPNFVRILIEVIPDDKLFRCVSTLLDSNFTVLPKSMDQYGIKARLLLRALFWLPQLRLLLPDDFQDKVIMDVKVPWDVYEENPYTSYYSHAGKFPTNLSQKTLGDILIDADFLLCADMVTGRLDENNKEKDIIWSDDPTSDDWRGLAFEEGLFGKFAREIIKLEGDGYKKGEYFSGLAPIGVPSKGIEDLYGATQKMIDEYRLKKVDKDEEKKES